MLITYIDILFVLAGLAGIVTGFMRRKHVPPPAPAPPASAVELAYTDIVARLGYTLPAPPASVVELALTALALIPAAVGVNVLVVALTPGVPTSMNTLTKYVLLPSIVLLGVVWVLAYRLGLERLTNRIWTGIWVGAVASAALDIIRLPGFLLGWMPSNNPRMFGVLILDQMALGPSDFSDFVGSLYHYWVGATFGLTYTLLIGRTRWWGGLIFGVFVIELGMMITPPVVYAMGLGYFGLKYGRGWEVLAVSVPAHIAYGVVMGLLLERYTKHKGWIWPLIKEAWASLGAPPQSSRRAA